MEIQCIETFDLPWIWKLFLSKESTKGLLANLFGSSSFAGASNSRDEAIAQALAAPARLQILGGRLIGSEAFTAGVVAGKAELKSQILKL